MSTSGSVNFSQNRDQIITRALNILDIVGIGRTPSATQISHAADVLNMLIKSWQGQTDFARGLKVWARKRGYLFLQTGQHEYTLPGDHWTNSYVTTTTTAAAISGASTIDIASATGMTASDYLGVELSTGALQWTTISGAPSTTLTLAASLTANVASGARVFAYTTRATRPLSLLAAVRRDVRGNRMWFSRWTCSNRSSEKVWISACSGRQLASWRAEETEGQEADGWLPSRTGRRCPQSRACARP